MRVLIVEDDPMIGEAVQVALKNAFYAADWVKDGPTALDAVNSQNYDLILLDLGLPGKDGLEVLTRIRAKGNSVSLLIITARDGLDDRVRGLDGGADDYVLKPFEIAELLARMRAVLRRKSGKALPVLSNGMVSLDPATREATMNAWLPGSALQPRVLPLPSLDGAARRHFVTERTGRPRLWMGRRGRKQRP